MTNFSKPQGGTPKNDGSKPGSKPAGQAQYKSKLDEILARAGNNNPIAAAQAKTGQAPQPDPAAKTPVQQPGPPQITPQPPAQTTGFAPQPTAPAQPQDPADKLQQILSMAGKTPAQRAQMQAQQAAANTAANIQAMIQNYMTAVAQDPRKVLNCDIEFPGNPGANDALWFKCYADQNGNTYWDAFGVDIAYIIPPKIAQYALYDDYYRGIPQADFMADIATATVHSHSIV